MTFLFWLLWLFDLLFGIFAILACRFRGSFTNDAPFEWVGVLFIICIVLGLVFRYVLKQEAWAWVAVLLPLILLIGWYLVDKLFG